MSFVELNIIFIVAAAVVFCAGLWSVRGTSGAIRGAVSSAGIALVVLIVLTAIFDNVMIASGLFDYGGQTLTGVHLGVAPVEDFAYPLCAALLLPGLWLLFSRKEAEKK